MPEQNISKILAERVERAIREAGYRSQEEFANVVGVPKATVNRILLGTYDVRISTLRKIAQGLGIPMGELLDIQEKKTHKKDSSFHTKGAKKKSGIVLKILVPKDEDIPKWLVDACREGVGQIENVPAKRRPKTTGSSKQRQVGLDEILGR